MFSNHKKMKKRSGDRNDLFEEGKKEIRNKHFERFWLISIPLLCAVLLILLALLLFFPTIKLKEQKCVLS